MYCRYVIRSYFLNMLMILKMLVIFVIVVLLVYSVGVFVVESLVNGIKCCVL